MIEKNDFYFQFNDDGHTVCLKEKDLEKLRDPKVNGLEFEVDEYNNGKMAQPHLFISTNCNIQ